MNRVIDPPLAVHDRLRQKLTPGEQVVLNFFHQYLPVEWEIYIQPHLNGLRPDFVLLNPAVGVAVFEVKDWNLDAMHYFVKPDKWGESLWAEKDGKEFCIQSDNPIAKAMLYKQEIYGLYCPRLGGNLRSDKKAGWAAVTAGVIFPFADRDRVERLLDPFRPRVRNEYIDQYQPISGAGELSVGDVRTVFPEAFRPSSKLMGDGCADDLRGWLVEPDFSTTQREPLTLDRNQRSLAHTRTESGYRRIKGAAGAGKSLVLAARAARLANEGKSVLVVTFNITLWHYLRDLIVRDLDAPSRIRNIFFTHFHSWCKRVCYEVGWQSRYDMTVNSSGSEILDTRIPALAADAVNAPGATKYDAILVDEGQDYAPGWWNALRNVCKPGGEMLLIADTTQDIYGKSKAWTDEAMHGAGFRGGRWAQLDVSYRLPPVLLDKARDFAQRFIPHETINLPEQDQGTLGELYPCALRWVQCDSHEACSVCIDEILALMGVTGRNGLANADITFLTAETKFGLDLVTQLEREHGIKTVNTFDTDSREQRRQKMAFYMGDARVKATMLHSFKGWEARSLVFYISNAADQKAMSLIYAGLTRLKRSVDGSQLTVVCSAGDLEDFGRTWHSN